MSGTDPRESNPNAAGKDGLQGGMGVSSERTGPFGGSDPTDEGIQGTGTRGSAAENTEGTMSTERQHPDEPAEGRRDIGEPGADSTSSQDSETQGGGTQGDGRHRADGPEMDDTQQQATQEWRDGQPAAGHSNDPEAEDDTASIDRTVGESNTAEVPSHEFDRTKNPGHSHG